MDCCLVIPIANRYELITHLLKSIKTFDGEIIFIVNGIISSKVITELDQYKKSRNDVRVLRRDEQLSFSEANNIAIKKTNSKYVILMNSDVFPFENALINLKREIESSNNIGAVQGVLLYPQNETVQSAGHIFFEYQNYHALKGSIFPCNFKTRKRQAISAAFCIIKKQIFDQIGGFDLFYTNAFEGMDLTAKISLLGYDCLVTSSAKGYHLQGIARDIIVRDESNDRGKFWATTGTKVSNDLISELQYNAADYNLNKYRRIFNVSQIREKQEFVEKLFYKSLEWINLPDKTKDNIIIQDNLSVHTLFSDLPAVWVTTHFSQIANNKMVFSDYARKNDLIIDLHSNVIPVKQLMKFFP